jgi:hypothetical protein
MPSSLFRHCPYHQQLVYYRSLIFAVSPILVTPSQDPTETVRKVKDFKRQIPGNGRPYFARRCLTAEGRDEYKTHWPMEILFNYLGQYQVCSPLNPPTCVEC